MTEPPGFALYVHVPWCRHVCPYCDFNVHARRRIPEREDVDAFVTELDAWAAVPPFAGGAVGSVFLGGGTPSLYSPAAIERLLVHVGTRCGLVAGAEVTLEANPGGLSAATLRGFRAAGVNRLSLGVQSFDAAVLRTLGRDHEPADGAAAVAAARHAGFDNVSLDLIFAVPGEALATWTADLDAAIALGPEHVSTYALTYEPGTPFTRWRDAGRVTPVDDDDEAEMGELACRRLANAGFERYEISSHARPGFASRHNQRYWDGSSYLGIGPGAHSFVATAGAERRWANERDPVRYRAAVHARGTAIASEERLSPARAESDYVVTGLRRLAGIDCAAFAARFGRPVDAAFPQLAALAADGLVERAGAALQLTPRGLRFADAVWAALL